MMIYQAATYHSAHKEMVTTGDKLHSDYWGRALHQYKPHENPLIKPPPTQMERDAVE